MKKNTITLKQSEVIELITETIIKIQEQSKDRITSQEQFLEVIKYIEKLYGPKDGNPTNEYKKWKKKVVTEQEVIDGEIYINPNQPLAPQIKKTNYELANSSPQQFVEFWFNRCTNAYGPVKKIENISREAEKCFTSMPQTSRNYMTGHNNTNRLTILLLWAQKANEILATISDDLVPKMSSYGDTSNFTAKEKEIYKKYRIWVNELYKQANYEALTLAESHWYHYVIDAISFISYMLCGITAGVGCVVSVVADICNALLYVYTKDDYYMAAMQLAFAVVPAGEALKYEAEFLRKPLTVIFKAFWNQTKIDAKIIAKEIAKLTPSELKLAREVFSKGLGKKISANYKAALVTAKGYYYIPGLQSMMTAAGVLLRALVLFIEMIWFDPEFTGGLLKIAGEFTGIEKLKSWGEAMEDWTKYGVKLANKFYESSGIGGIEALVQTSIADCNNTVYNWEYVKDTYMAQNSLDVLDEEELEKDWWNGWRPPAQIEGGRSGPRKMPDSEDTEAMEVIKEEYEMYGQYVAMKGCKKMTEGDTYGPWLTSCAKFKSMYDALAPEERFKMLLTFIAADEVGEC